MKKVLELNHYYQDLDKWMSLGGSCIKGLVPMMVALVVAVAL
jgi:hypothetical protein